MKKIITLLISISLMSCLVGCSSFSFQDAVFGTGEDVILGSMTEMEWGIKSQKEIGTLITSGETLLSGSRYVLKGETPYAEELVDANYAIEEANIVYSNIEQMAAPDSKLLEKDQTLQAVTSYKNAILEYATALEKQDDNLINSAVNSLSSSINDLVAYSGDFNS